MWVKSLVWLAEDGCGWNPWVWLVGAVVRRLRHYRFPKKITFPSLLLLYLHFWEHHIYVHFFTFQKYFYFYNALSRRKDVVFYVLKMRGLTLRFHDKNYI